MFTMTVMINYKDKEQENTFEFETINELLDFIAEDLKKELDASSFVYTIARQS